MTYIAGQIHESLQKYHYYEVMQDFTIPICVDKRNGELQNIFFLTGSIDLSKGDIIKVRFYKYYQPTSGTYSDAYIYLDTIIKVGSLVEIGKESMLSLALLKANKFLFNDVTVIYERDAKIKLLIDV